MQEGTGVYVPKKFFNYFSEEVKRGINHDLLTIGYSSTKVGFLNNKRARRNAYTKYLYSIKFAEFTGTIA